MLMHGQLFLDKNNNIGVIEGTQKIEKKQRVNYIYLKNDDGWITINNQKYIKVTKNKEGYWNNYKKQEQILIENHLNYEESSIYPFIQLENLNNIQKLSNPTKIFLKYYKENKKLIDGIIDILSIKDITKIGMIGSMQIGIYNNKSDIDLIFMYDKLENYRIFKTIQKIISKGNELYGKGERNRINPLRFLFHEKEICVHFRMPNDLTTKYYISENEKGLSIEKEYIIKDISESIYTPTILKTECNTILIMYHGGDRGIFEKGDVLNVVGKKYSEERVVVSNYEKYMG